MGYRANDEMRRLLDKHPDGIDGFTDDALVAGHGLMKV